MQATIERIEQARLATVSHLESESTILFDDFNQVDNLVNAMAAFGVPAGGEINLSQVQRDQLDVVIAANW